MSNLSPISKPWTGRSSLFPEAKNAGFFLPGGTVRQTSEESGPPYTFMKTKLLLLLLACLLGAGTLRARAGDMDQNLIARWTFKDGSLRSDVGDFEFQEGERGSLESGEGTVTLLGRKFLFCPEISSASQPDLQKSITVWARVKFNELPKEGELGVMGLQAGQGAGSWPALIFSLLYRPMSEDPSHAGMAFLARTPEAGELGVGIRRFQPVSAGEFIHVAIVFNSQTQTAAMWVSSTGQWAESKKPGAGSLDNFDAFLIGKLIMPGAETAVTFDEVRIYSTALDAQWLEEISVVEEK